MSTTIPTAASTFPKKFFCENCITSDRISISILSILQRQKRYTEIECWLASNPGSTSSVLDIQLTAGGRWHEECVKKCKGLGMGKGKRVSKFLFQIPSFMSSFCLPAKTKSHLDPALMHPLAPQSLKGPSQPPPFSMTSKLLI